MTEGAGRLRLGRYEWSLDRPLVMGILNVTPDSFSDGGQHFGLQQALDAAARLQQEGADILDIGGESTRPGAQPVSEQQEADRVLPVLEALQSLGIALSLDSRRPSVVAQALSIGVDLVNDVTGFTQPEMQCLLPRLAAGGQGICIMHMQGEPQTMQQAPHYTDVVDEVARFLGAQQAMALQAGLATHQILLDPGFGFGKTLQHNLALFAALPRLAELGPCLVGVSRKRMLGELTGREGPASERLGASLAAALAAARSGAAVLRVHDVAQTVDALRVGAALGLHSPHH